ncbi:hypothetical protein XH87_09765 [Bradyrhizobium sp. CCBAU 53415]|nr:hypothetical protein [Bradyrhizobium sp. CCBAU 53415]
MMREAISVSPDGSDGGADLSQFCDSRGRGNTVVSRTRCNALRVAAQSRDPYVAENEIAETWAPAQQRTTSQGRRTALRPGHEMGV